MDVLIARLGTARPGVMLKSLAFILGQLGASSVGASGQSNVVHQVFLPHPPDFSLLSLDPKLFHLVQLLLAGGLLSLPIEPLPVLDTCHHFLLLL